MREQVGSHVAGAFGARNIPKHLRTVEILGIIQARKWYISLAET